MTINKKFLAVIMLIMFTFALGGCLEPTSTEKQNTAQENTLKQAIAAVGAPSILNWFEMRQLKEIYEQRDNVNLVTYSYIWSDHAHNFIFVGESVGYGVPASTQFSNPQKRENGYTMTNAEPNGLYPPGSARGTYIQMKNPKTKKVEPQYIETDVNVFTYKLPNAIYPGGYGQP